MKNTKYIFTLAFALLALPFVSAAVEYTNEELYDFIADLEARIVVLEEDLETAQADLETAQGEIEDLQTQIDDIDTTSVSDTDTDEDSTTVTTPVRGNGVAVCHNGKTQYVNVNSALTYKSQGATIGVCTQEQLRKQSKYSTSVGDDEDDDSADDEEEDDSTDDDTEDDTTE